jgi:hypothetical protein
VIFLRVDDVEKNIGVLRCGFRIEKSPPRVLEVLSTDFLTVTPQYIITQMENDPLAAIGYIPGLGDHRRRLEIPSKLRETYHQIGDDVERNPVGG